MFLGAPKRATRGFSDASALAQHYREHHQNECNAPAFKAKIIDRVVGQAKRKISEALIIHNNKPALNARYEGGTSMNADLWLDLEESMRRNRRRNLQRRMNG